MRSASVAEWILGRVTSDERAASVVGDLEELRTEKGAVWFWLSLARVLLAFCWRRVVGVIAAFYAGGWVMSGFMSLVFGINAKHHPEGPLWSKILSVLSGLGAIFWMLFVYGGIRYGLRDRTTRLALIYAGLATATSLCWWQPFALITCIVLSLILATVSIMKWEDRTAMLVLISALSTGFASYFLTGYIEYRYQKLILPGLMGSRELQEHPSIVWVTFFLMLMSVWNMTTVYSRVHAWMKRKRHLVEPL